jgi:hypothetical protein
LSTIVSAVVAREGKASSFKLDHCVRDYTLTIIVQCDDAAYPHNDLINYDDPIPAPPGGTGGDVTLPVVGTDVYPWTAAPEDAGALCVGWAIKQIQNTYIITYTYSSAPPIPSDRIEAPTSRPSIWRVSWQKTASVIQIDLDGASVVNSAGQPFEQPLAINRSLPVFEVTQNYPSYAFSLLTGLMDTINQSDWTPVAGGMVYPAYSCYMDSISYDPLSENGTNYIAIKYRFIYDSDLYYPCKILDCGYNTLVAGKLTEIKAAFGSKLQKPALLNGSGGLSTTGGVYLNFDVYFPADWDTIVLIPPI